MPHLLFQKIPGKTKQKDIVDIIKRRLALWNEGQFLFLLHESKALQAHIKLPSSSNCPDNLAQSVQQFSIYGKHQSCHSSAL